MADAIQAIRQCAEAYSEVDISKSCTQDAFKTKGKAFLYLGEQGGRHKAMFKLNASREEAETLAAERPKDFQVGSGNWVTVRFDDEAPLPKALWQKWLAESYAISR